MPTSWAPWPGNSQATDDAVAAGRNSGWELLAKAGALDLNGLTPLVVSADRTGVVRPPHGPALRTAGEAGQLQRQVTAALALTGLWVTFLWQWGHSLLFL